MTSRSGKLVLIWNQLLRLKFKILELKFLANWPYFGVKLSCVCLVTYSHPMVTLTYLKMTFTNPEMTCTNPKLTKKVNWSLPKLTNVDPMITCSDTIFQSIFLNNDIIFCFTSHPCISRDIILPYFFPKTGLATSARRNKCITHNFKQ